MLSVVKMKFTPAKQVTAACLETQGQM